MRSPQRGCRAGEAVRVTVRLFARLRDIAGRAELTREMPDGATAGEVWKSLVEQFPAMAGYDSSISTAVNADYAKMSTVLSDNDEVAFLPPVSGGQAPGPTGPRLRRT